MYIKYTYPDIFFSLDFLPNITNGNIKREDSVTRGIAKYVRFLKEGFEHEKVKSIMKIMVILWMEWSLTQTLGNSTLIN